jgi:hypothetical protein
MKIDRIRLFAATVFISGCFYQSPASQAEIATLPVYEVTGPGATEAQTKQLSEMLKIARLALKNGAISFIDEKKFLSVPEVRTPAKRYAAIDFDAVKKLGTFDDGVAAQSVSEAFKAPVFHLENGTAVVTHTNFSASYTDEKGVVDSVSRPVDTHVSYTFIEEGNTPLIGPGAQAQVTFGPQGQVTHLRYALRELKPGPSVQLISESAIRNRIAQRESANARVDLRLVYWAPSFDPSPGGCEPVKPTIIIPWYAYDLVTHAGESAEVHSKERLIPATDDPRYVPNLELEVSGQGETTVAAHVKVRDGRPPYTYLWTGSDAQLSESTKPDFCYTPMVSAKSSAATSGQGGETIAVDETVSVRVVDANGVAVEASKTFPVLARIVSLLNQRPAPKSNSAGTLPTYGTESPHEPAFTNDRLGWQEGMGTRGAGGGSEKFNAFGGLHIMTGWSSKTSVDDGSFERDFAENMLGVSGPPQTVVEAWFNAAETAGREHGTAAAMGPIGPKRIDDRDDHYVGKGSRGPTILPADIRGFWYLTQ